MSYHESWAAKMWHSLLAYLDRPFLPLFTWEHWSELTAHVVGSWRVPTLPGNYGTEECETIVSLLGIRTAAVASCIFLHK